MVDLLVRNWGFVALRGVAGILFGIATLIYPVVSLAVLVLLFGAYSLVDGVFAAVSAVANRREQPRWVPLLLSGLLGIGIGLVTLFWPGVTALALLYIIAFWAVIIGILEIVAAVRLRKLIKGEWLLALAGVLSVLFGILIAVFPGVGVLAMVVWIGAFALVNGVLHLVLAFRLRRWGREGLGAGSGVR